MIKNPIIRRTLSIVLLVVGGLFIFLAPQNAWIGFVLLGAGLMLEIISYDIRHDDKPNTK
jgi:Zn-dependent membrane protease YugP